MLKHHNKNDTEVSETEKYPLLRPILHPLYTFLYGMGFSVCTVVTEVSNVPDLDERRYQYIQSAETCNLCVTLN